MSRIARILLTLAPAVWLSGALLATLVQAEGPVADRVSVICRASIAAGRKTTLPPFELEARWMQEPRSSARSLRWVEARVPGAIGPQEELAFARLDLPVPGRPVDPRSDGAAVTSENYHPFHSAVVPILLTQPLTGRDFQLEFPPTLYRPIFGEWILAEGRAGGSVIGRWFAEQESLTYFSYVLAVKEVCLIPDPSGWTLCRRSRFQDRFTRGKRSGAGEAERFESPASPHASAWETRLECAPSADRLAATDCDRSCFVPAGRVSPSRSHQAFSAFR